MKKRLLPVLALLLTAFPLAAQTRTALVVGNGAYRHVPALRQSEGEARQLGAALERLDFDVQLILDAAEDELRLALLDFEDTLKRKGGIALFFYGGHAVQADGKNYLLPVDANIRDARLIPYKAVALDEVLDRMEVAGKDANIVILDACRENPLPGAGAEGGLAAVSRPPPNTIVFYAAKAGKTAEDGLFVPTLLRHVETPRMAFADVLAKTINDVGRMSEGRQQPWSDGVWLSHLFLTGRREAIPDERPNPAPAESAPRVRAGDGFVFVEGGTFEMGSREGDYDEQPIRSVTLDDFWMSPYEVTQQEYEAVMGENPSEFDGEDNPVTELSWYDAVEYCNALSRREGLDPVYSGSGDDIQADFSKKGYRLPTEAEWEYAARGGRMANNYKYSGSGNLGRVAWYEENSGGEPHPAGGKKPNELGLYDMSGNVWEWCWDWYYDDYYRSGDQTDPRGPADGEDRIFRGGSFLFEAEFNSVTLRLGSEPETAYGDIGIRLCTTAE